MESYTVIAEKPGKYSWNDGGVVYSATFGDYKSASNHMRDIMDTETTPNGHSTISVMDDTSGAVIEPGVFLDIIVACDDTSF